jgi:hypothetical protein
MRTLLTKYVEGWKTGRINTVLETLTERCVITECYGPVYKGRETVRQWMRTWFSQGGQVLQWDITSFVGGQNSAAIEWIFRCRWHGREFSFAGASVVWFAERKIEVLREYTTTAPLYEWHGEWKTQ